MDLGLPTLLTADQLTAWAATIAVFTAIVQTLSFVPIADGSKARAWVTAAASALVIALVAIGVDGEPAAIGASAFLSWIGLAAAGLGINRGGSYTVKTVQERTAEAPVADYDPNKPQG